MAHLESPSDNELKKLIDDEETLDGFIAGLPFVVMQCSYGSMISGCCQRCCWNFCKS